MSRRNNRGVIAALAASITVFTFGSILAGGKYGCKDEDPLLVISDERVPLAGIGNELTEDMGYSLDVGGVMITMDAPALPIIARLGTPATYQESDNKDRIYQYDGFEIATYDQDGTDYIAAVFIMDESVITSEGIGIGMSKDDTEEVYGVEYIEEDDMIIYKKNDMGLEFLVSDDKIIYIQYLSARYM